MELPRKCPLCEGRVVVVRWRCRSCGTEFHGTFTPPKSPLPFERLTPEQLHFLEVFLRSEGKFSRMEQELGLSYPTLRNRLRGILRALGLAPTEPASAKGVSAEALEEARARILDDLEAGRISAEEAVQRLRSLRVR